MTEPWQRRRSELNHLRLRSRFLTAVVAAANRAGDAVTLLQDQSSAGDRLSAWPALSEDLRALIDDFESAMSPAVYVDRPPLAGFNPNWRENVRPCIHALWLARYPVRTWMTDARNALSSANAQYGVVFPSGAAPVLTRSALLDFHALCVELSERISRFPERIPIV
jgi:hypothetical protein